MQPNAPYVLILDDDSGLTLSLRHLFEVICEEPAEIYSVASCARDRLRQDAAPKLVVLGKLPGADRAALIHDVLTHTQAFLVVVDRNETPDEGTEAFLAGAHDVVRYPLSLREFALRMRARIGLLDTEAGQRILQDSNGWDSAAYIAGRAQLTSAEAQIAHILMSHRGEIVTRDVLSYAIDQRPWDYGDRKFDVHVAKIRKKLDACFGVHVSVKTVRSAGYILNIDEAGFQKLVAKR